MSVDMLFVDENSTVMQGFIGANRHLRFRNRPSEGSLYTLTGFDVTRSNTNFRLADAPFSIRLNEGTELEKIPTSVRPIPREVFRFMPYSQILELANTGKQLPGMSQIDMDLPRSLAEIVGRTYTFQLKLNDYNFSSKHQTFTISRIYPERVLAPTPAFVVAEGANDPDDALPKDVGQATNVNAGTSSSGSDRPGAYDVSVGKRPPPSKAAMKTAMSRRLP